MATLTKVSQTKPRIIENFVVVWLDPQIDEFQEDYEQSITKLRRIVNSIKTYNDIDGCLKFLRTIKDERIFVIVSGGFGRQIIDHLQSMQTVVTVYVFCFDEETHRKWAVNYKKVKEVFTNIDPLCKMLRDDVHQSNSDLVSFSVLTPSTVITEDSLNELDQSFMYSQLLKEILLEMTYDYNSKDELVKFCRIQYEKNPGELDVIKEFEKYYPKKTKTNHSSPIWWYTRESFIYAMLNRALRTQDIEIIIKMGFFVRDLHEHIKKLQSISDKSQMLTVYRGQGMLPVDVERLEKSKGGLLSFNNFLSTSMNPAASSLFVQRALENPEHIGIHFLMKVNPKLASTPFAQIDDESFFDSAEQEILFSMHTVFRIDDVKQKNARVWDVYLTLTSDSDQKLNAVTNYIRDEIKGKTGWHRLASLFTKMGAYEKSINVYDTLLQQITDKNDWEELSYLHHQLGYNYKQIGDLSKALTEYQSSLNIELKYHSPDDSCLTPIYSNIGEIYRLKHDLKQALDYFERALTIEQQSKQPNQLKIASYYNNIGMVLSEQGCDTKALENYENTLRIKLKELPKYHPSLATTYNNIGGIHYILGDYSKAYSYFQKALEVEEKVLPSTHNSLSTTHAHMAMALSFLNRNDEALKHAKHALDIARQNYEPNHKQIKIYEDHIQRINKRISDN